VFLALGKSSTRVVLQSRLEKPVSKRRLLGQSPVDRPSVFLPPTAITNPDCRCTATPFFRPPPRLLNRRKPLTHERPIPPFFGAMNFPRLRWNELVVGEPCLWIRDDGLLIIRTRVSVSPSNLKNYGAFGP